MESGGVTRRRRMLPDEKVDSPNLRDFLRIKENEDGHSSLSGLTLHAVLAGETRRSQMTRTLLDIIRDDPNTSKESKRTWKAFKDKLRLRRAGAAWTSSVPIPVSDVPIQIANRLNTRRNSTRFPATDINSDDPLSESAHLDPQSSSDSISGGDNRVDLGAMLRRNSSRVPSLAASGYGRGGSMELNTTETGDVNEEEGAEEEGGGESETAGRMSLMALLAETDRQMGMDGIGSTFIMDDEEEEEEEVEQEASRGVEFNCCVCMVRHKGSAFIPCGHTFCRLCSRELWVQRGNCPICNGFILEILDIF